MNAPETPVLRPWPGLASFTEAQAGSFFGRDEEIADLLRRVQRKRLTVLFGQSGLGKTSLLQAGLMPRLPAVGLLPVRVRMAYDPAAPSPAEQIKQALQQATAASGRWTRPGVARPGETLWEFLHHRDDQLLDASGQVLRPLLVFDQFEELFTLAQGDQQGRRRAARFVEELADLAENRVPSELEQRLEQGDDTVGEPFDFARDDYRVLLSLREDYLAELESLKSRMPSITQNRLRLEPLRGVHALQAVRGPAPGLVDEPTAEAILRFVAGADAERPLNDVTAEPSLLSLVLYELNEQRLAQGQASISTELLAGSQVSILQDFYERSLADQPNGVRCFIEDVLLTDSGYRENVAEERARHAFEEAGAGADALDRLVNRRLLRVEERLDLRRVELTHDVLCAVVRASRDSRREREAREASERALQAEAERARGVRRQLVRARQVAAICGVLALGAVSASVYAWRSSERARAAEQRADLARNQAESLVGFLLDDFYVELQPLGRLDILLKLSQRTVDYYDKLPPELQSSQTTLNRALAQVRHGVGLGNQNRLQEAQPLLAEARAELERRFEAGDRGEPVLVSLGLVERAQARALYNRGNPAASAEMAQRGVDRLRPEVDAHPQWGRLRRTLGELLGYLGYVQWQALGQNEAAVKNLEAAQNYALAPSAGDERGDTPSDAGLATYVGAAGWMVPALTDLGRYDYARQVAEDGLRRIDAALARRPDDAALVAQRASLHDGLSLLSLAVGAPDDAIRQSVSARQDWAALSTRDPTNGRNRNNLAVTHLTEAGGHEQRGDLRAAMASLQRGQQVMSTVTATDFTLNNQLLVEASTTVYANELGDDEAVDAALKRIDSLSAKILARPGGDVQAPRLATYAESLRGLGLFGRGDLAGARKLGQAVLARIAAADGAPLPMKLEFADVGSRVDGMIAEIALTQGQWVEAEAHAAQAVRRWNGDPTPTDRPGGHFGTQIEVLLALAQARQGHVDAARATLEPALATTRDRAARAQGSASIRLELAQALYVQSLIETGPRRAALRRQAEALMQGLPASMQQLRSVRRWQRWMREA